MNASDELKTRLVKYENSTTPLSKFHVNEKKAQMHNKDASNNAKGAISNNDNENIPEKNAKGARKQGGQSKRKWKRYTMVTPDITEIAKASQ